nr:unnamed protein product [Digitaria exilis]
MRYARRSEALGIRADAAAGEGLRFARRVPLRKAATSTSQAAEPAATAGADEDDLYN